MKIALTGASGFLGGHVLKALHQRNAVVTAATRKAERLKDWASFATVIEWDIANASPNAFESFGKPDVLIHLAWDGLPNYKSLHHFETELPQQYHFLKSMIDAGLPSLVAVGTCFEYGMQTGQMSEDTPTRPSNPYGFAKDSLRKQLEFLKSVRPFSLTWGRLFYLYGDGQPKGSLYPQLRDAVARGDAVFNMSGGEQVRDYLPVTQVAERIVDLAFLKEGAGIVNICSGRPIKVRSLVEQWIQQNNWTIQLNLGHYPYPDYEPMEFWGDASRIQTLCCKA